MNARVGSLTATPEWFMPWRTIADENDWPAVEFELEKVVRGFFRPDLFLDYIRYFVIFEQDGDTLIKKIAGYHQFHGVREAVRVTLIASATEESSRVKEERATYGKEVVPGSRKAGVFWHTQGSGKSISMCCYAGKLCGTLDEAAAVRMEIAFFSAIKATLVKSTSVDRKHSEETKNSALKQILDNAVISEGMTDIFALAGLEKPNIALLSDAFLEDVRKTPLKNLAVELLEKLLRDEIRSNSRTNLVQEKKYSERLLETLRRYHNRAIETAQVIEELIALAKDFQAALARNEELGLSPDEVAFYDALAEKPEVLHEMGDEALKKLAEELTQKLRSSTTVDWQVRDSVRAKMRILIRQLLRKYKYPPEGYEDAITMVLKQAEALADEWSSKG